MNNKTNDIVDNMDTREAILELVKDLRKYANWEYEQDPKVLGQAAYKRNRRDSILFAADYIEKAL